jgi:hypothetical protein
MGTDVRFSELRYGFCKDAVSCSGYLASSDIVTCMSDYRRGFGLDIGFIDYLHVVTRNNYNTIAISSFGGLPPIVSSWRQAPWETRPVILFFQLNTCSYNPAFRIAAGLASRVILRSESRGTHDHILLSQIRDSSNMEGQVPIFMSPRNIVDSNNNLVVSPRGVLYSKPDWPMNYRS